MYGDHHGSGSNSIGSNESRPKIKAYADGCYDLMHAGHFNSLRQASMLSDWLVSGVNSDAEILAAKGPTVFNIDERGEIVRAGKWVDEVAPDTEYTPTIETLDRLNGDFYAHGDDISIGSDGLDCAHKLKSVGRFKMFKRTKGISTTNISAKLIEMNESHFSENNPEEEEEHKNDSACKGKCSQISINKLLGSYNSNPNFLGSAKRIAQFSSMRETTETDKIVYVDGSFDIYHPGHIELLKKSQELGDYLIVGIHEDQCVNEYLGSSYPVNTLHERVLNILAGKYVDDVIIGAPFIITEKLLKDLNVSVVVKGLDYLQGSIKSYALDQNPYEVPDKKEILTEVELEGTMSINEIAERILKNKEALIKKVERGSKKNLD